MQIETQMVLELLHERATCDPNWNDCMQAQPQLERTICVRSR